MRFKTSAIIASLVLIVALSVSVSAASVVTFQVDDMVRFDKPETALAKYANLFLTDIFNVTDPLFRLTVENTSATEAVDLLFTVDFYLDGDRKATATFEPIPLNPKVKKVWELRTDELNLTYEDITNMLSGNDVKQSALDEARRVRDETLADWKVASKEVFDTYLVSSENIEQIGRDLVATGQFPAGNYQARFSLSYRNASGNVVSVGTQSITINITNPGPVKLTGPTGEITGGQPTFTWQLPEIPSTVDPTAELVIRQGSSVVHEVSVDPAALEYQYPATGANRLVPGLDHTWQLVLTDAAGRVIGGTTPEAGFSIRNTPPVPSITSAPPQALIAGDTFTFRGSASDAEDGGLSDASLVWRVGGSVVGTGSSVEIPFSRAGSYTVSLTAVDSGGSTDSQSVLVTVDPNQPPVVQMTEPADLTQVKTGSSVTFRAQAQDPEGEGVTLSWSVSGDAQWQPSQARFENVNEITLSVSGAGRVNVRVTAQDARGTTSSSLVRVQVVPDTPPTITFTSPADGASLREGDTLSLTATATDAEDGDLSAGVRWFVNDAAAGQGAAVTYPASGQLAPGQYRIRGEVLDSAGHKATAMSNVTVVANQAPSVAITRPQAGQAFTLEGQSATVAFAAEVSDPEGDSLTVQWTDSTSPATAASGTSVEHTVVFDEPGSYTVGVTVTDPRGLSNSADIIIVVREPIVEQHEPPTVTIDSPAVGTTVTAGQSVHLAAAATDYAGDAATVNWRIGTTTIGSGSEMDYTFTETGTVAIVAVATDSGGRTSSATVDVVIEANDPPEVAITSPTAGTVIVQGDSIQLSGIATDPEGGNVSVRWEMAGDVLATQSGASPLTISNTFTPQRPGRYTFALTATDASGASALASVAVQVNLNTPPEVSITSPADATRVVLSDGVTVDGSASDPDGRGIQNYAWFVNGQAQTGATTPTLTWDPPSAGAYTVTLQATDVDGMINTSAISINAVPNSAPAVKMVTAGGEAVPTSVSVDDTLELQAVAEDIDGDAITLAWNAGGATVSGPAAEFTFDTAGKQTVVLTATDARGASTSTSVDIMVAVPLPENQAPVIANRLTSPRGASLDFGQATTFEVDVTDANDAVEDLAIMWRVSPTGNRPDSTVEPGTVIGSGPSITYTFTESGPFTLEVTAADPHGAAATGTFNVAVTPNKAPTIDVTSPTANATVNLGEPVSLSAAVDDADGIDSVIWYANNKPVITGIDAQATFHVPGTYDLSVQAKDVYGSLSDKTITINVVQMVDDVPVPTIQVPRTELTIAFDGESVDFEAQNVAPGTEIVWVSNLQDVIGTGESISIPLDVGVHRIALEADGFEVDSRQVDVQAAIEEAEPVAIVVQASGAPGIILGTRVADGGVVEIPDGGTVILFYNGIGKTVTLTGVDSPYTVDEQQEGSAQ